MGSAIASHSRAVTYFCVVSSKREGVSANTLSAREFWQSSSESSNCTELPEEKNALETLDSPQAQSMTSISF